MTYRVYSFALPGSVKRVQIGAVRLGKSLARAVAIGEALHRGERVWIVAQSTGVREVRA